MKGEDTFYGLNFDILIEIKRNFIISQFSIKNYFRERKTDLKE